MQNDGAILEKDRQADYFAPVIMFIYNRPAHTRRTLEALSNNYGADKTTLYIFADGAQENATQEDLKRIEQVRYLALEKPWCREVFLTVREKNMALEDNVINGVTEIMSKHEKAIILEDDIITSTYFLNYCNDGLEMYRDDKRVFSINGFMVPIDFQTPFETFLCPVATSSWGWATWADRWALFETNPAAIQDMKGQKLLEDRFNVGGMNKTYMLYYMNTWDIRWYYTAFIRNGLGLFPTKSLTMNIGFDGSGTHKGNEDLVQELFESPAPVTHTDSIDLGHYARLLNYVKIEPLTFKQKIKNRIKRLIRYRNS